MVIASVRELANGCRACGASKTYCECVHWIDKTYCCSECDGENHRQQLQT